VPGQPFCESAAEGRFVSNEPALFLSQQLDLGGKLGKDAERALKEVLAARLGISLKYINISKPSGDETYVSIDIVDDSLSAYTLTNLTSNESFWQGVIKRVVANGAVTTLDASNITVQAVVSGERLASKGNCCIVF
jgi:hypothetical protein